MKYKHKPPKKANHCPVCDKKENWLHFIEHISNEDNEIIELENELLQYTIENIDQYGVKTALYDDGL